MNKTNQKNILLFIAAIVLFVIFSCIYFFPLLQGKTLVQSDVINALGASKEVVDYHDKTGDVPLWTNSLFGGMPTYQIGLYDTGNAFDKVFKIISFGLPRPISYMFVCLLSFFILLRSFRINYALSLSGAFCYALGTYLITFIQVGHNSKVHALATLPFVLAGMSYLFKKHFWLGAALTLFGLCMQITAGHPQITYYMFFIIGIWMLSEFVIAIKAKQIMPFIKTAAVIIISVLLAVGANTARYWTTFEYSKESIRGGSELTQTTNTETSATGLNKDYAFAWSSGIPESFSIMYPNFSGGGNSQSFLKRTEDGAISPDNDSKSLTFLQNIAQTDQKKAQQLLQVSDGLTTYWGDMPFTAGPVYVGSILCFLFLLGAFLAKNNMRWWLIAATVLSLFLGWGKYFPAFNNFMFDYFPMYDKFRTVSMAMIILCVTIPLLALYITDRFLTNQTDYSEKEKFNALKWSAIIAGASGLLLLMPASFFDLIRPDEQNYIMQAKDGQTTAFFDLLKDERAAMIRADVLKSLFLIALAAGALWLYLKKKIKPVVVILVIALIPVIDLLVIDSKYLNKDDYQEGNYYEQLFRQANPVIKDNDPDYRVFNTAARLDQDGITCYYYKNLGGYHGAKMQRYQDMIDGYLSKGNLSTLSMLNTKYVISNRGGKFSVDRNPMACGNAWFVDSIAFVNTPDEEFASLAKFDPLQSAFVNETYKSQIPEPIAQMDSLRTIALTKYSPNEMTYHSKNQFGGAAIFSEIYYRGNEDWKAYIDGKYVDHFRANYILRGLYIPAGEHEIVFKFEPDSYYTGKKVSASVSYSAILLVLIGFYMSSKNAFKKKNTDATK